MGASSIAEVEARPLLILSRGRFRVRTQGGDRAEGWLTL